MAGLLRFEFEFEGDKQVNRRLSIAAEAVQDLRFVWGTIHGTGADHVAGKRLINSARTFLRIERDQFKSEGARGPHGAWDRYSREPKYRARKAGILHADWEQMPILRWVKTWQDRPGPRERLYPSMVEAHDPSHKYDAQKLSVEMGLESSMIPYARKHQLGQGVQQWDDITIPRRRIVDLQAADMNAWTKAIHRFVHYFVEDVRSNRRFLHP